MSTHTTSKLQKTLPKPLYLSDIEIANRYSVGRATVWRWAKNNPDFPKPIKLAGCTRWRVSDLVVWEEQQEGASKTAVVAA